MPVLYWDAESRSAVSLRESGAHIYAADPSTEVLFFCYAVDDDSVETWRQGDPPPAPFLAAAADPAVWKIVSDNWTFERALYEHILIPRFGFPPLPLEVHDCAERLALANAYPAELGQRAEALGLPYRKDPAARRAMLAISRPMKLRGKNKATAAPQWDEDPAKYALVLERCKLDVITTRACWNAPQLKHLSTTERGYLLLDARINDRGVHADVEFVNAARELAVKERIATNLRLQELTDGAITSVDQVQRVLDAVNSHGHRMTTVTKRAVATVLAGKPDDYVRELLTLRRNGAHASVKKLQRVLAYAGLKDQRIRGTLRIYGAGPGRWSGLGPQLQNLKRNDSNLPLDLIEAVRRGDREALARYGNPLTLLGDLSRAMICAAPGNVLVSGDFGQIESRVLAWLAGEQWKLDGYAQFDATGDKAIEVYRVVARRMLQKTTLVSAITQAERQIGKAADLAAGFGGGPGAWHRIVEHETRTDDEIKALIRQWRDAHPAVCRFWKELARAIRIAIRADQPVLVAPAPRPPIVAAFADGNLTLTLPSGRAITYPQARLVPGKFEDGNPDVQFMDNARGQWKPYRGWFGTFVENVVQGCARDLLAAAIARFEARGIPVVFHCHDEVTCEVPNGAISETEFLQILLKAPAWAAGLPLGGKVHSGTHYLEPPETPAEPLAPTSEAELIEAVVDDLVDEVELPPAYQIDWGAKLEQDFPRATINDGNGFDHQTDDSKSEAEREAYIEARMRQEGLWDAADEPSSQPPPPHSGNERIDGDSTNDKNSDGYPHGERNRGHQVAFFVYRHANNQPYLGVRKTSTKEFPQFHWTGRDWARGAPQGPKIPYRLPQLIAAPLDAWILICAGEKDADTAADLSFVATTNPEGERKDAWAKAPELNAWFHSRRVAIMEDNDATGRAHVLEVAEALRGKASDIRIVTFHELKEHGDLTDWVDAEPKRSYKDLLGKIETTKAYCYKPQPSPIRQWDGEPIPELEYAVPNRFPLENVGLFSGEGGEGKSSLIQQLCVAHPIVGEWLGCIPRQGPAIYIECEDAERVLRWRLAAIAAHYKVSLSAIADAGFHMYPLVDEESAVLATAPDKSGIVRPTPLYDWLYELAGDIKPVMIGIASSANVFAGNENSRTEVQQFIRLLRRIACVAQGTVLLVAQPSLSGLDHKSASHHGLSGTTQWHNAVRARAVMSSVKSEDGIDTGLRQIKFHKNQYGPPSAACFVRYDSGLFLPVEGMSMDAAERAAKADDVFVMLLRRFGEQGRRVSAKINPSNYAPTTFARLPEAVGLTKKDLSLAMERLLHAGIIENRSFTKGSEERSYLACTGT